MVVQFICPIGKIGGVFVYCYWGEGVNLQGVAVLKHGEDDLPEAATRNSKKQLPPGSTTRRDVPLRFQPSTGASP